MRGPLSARAVPSLPAFLAAFALASACHRPAWRVTETTDDELALKSARAEGLDRAGSRAIDCGVVKHWGAAWSSTGNLQAAVWCALDAQSRPRPFVLIDADLGFTRFGDRVFARMPDGNSVELDESFEHGRHYRATAEHACASFENDPSGTLRCR